MRQLSGHEKKSNSVKRLTLPSAMMWHCNCASSSQRKGDRDASAINKQRGRHKIEELLPWHATGTLSRRDADRVEQALAGDRELTRRYELVRQELADTTRLNAICLPMSKNLSMQ